jgi:phage shock protein A
VSRIKLWTASLLSRVDWMVSQVENHEAHARSAIREVQRAAARARVQLERVRADGRRLRERLEGTRRAAEAWRDRARSEASADEARALECLRRSRRAARVAAALAERREEHERVEARLAQDVARVEERLGELRERHNLLRTRQSRAEALAAVRGAGEPLGADLGGLFERWETQVTEREFEGECSASGAEGEVLGEGDAFASEFAEREEDETLRAELARLVSEPPAEEHPNA